LIEMATKAKVTITDVDHGAAAFLKRMKEFQKPRIDVGILSGEGHADDPHGPELTLVEVAVFNEFGTTGANGEVHVPERSFIRSWFDTHEESLKENLVTLMKRVAKGELTKSQALEQIGLRAVGQIQELIASSIPPPNAPSTIAKKGSSTTLIDQGQLRQGITHRVVEGVGSA